MPNTHLSFATGSGSIDTQPHTDIDPKSHELNNLLKELSSEILRLQAENKRLAEETFARSQGL